MAEHVHDDCVECLRRSLDRVTKELAEQRARNLAEWRKVVDALGPGEPLTRIAELKGLVDGLQREIIDNRNADLLTQKRWNHCAVCGASKGLPDDGCAQCRARSGVQGIIRGGLNE